MRASSYAIRGTIASALLAAVACGARHEPVHDGRRPTRDASDVRPHTHGAAGVTPVTLREEGAEFTIDPTTLGIESRGVSLSRPIATVGATVTELTVTPDRVTFHLPDQGLEIVAWISQARLTVHISSSRAQTIEWPRPSSRDVRALALPVAEGLSISPDNAFWQGRLFSEDCRTAHGGLSMPFFGRDPSCVDGDGRCRAEAAWWSEASAAARIATTLPSDDDLSKTAARQGHAELKPWAIGVGLHTPSRSADTPPSRPLMGAVGARMPAVSLRARPDHPPVASGAGPERKRPRMR